MWRIVRAIIKRLKTGLQWRELPIKSLFGRHQISWKTVYYYFSKWTKDGSWYRMWTELLKVNKRSLDMSSIQIDGSHTPCKRGGEQVAYQGRKKCKTSNMLFLTDKKGIVLACSDPISGNHNDLFEIKKNVSKIFNTLTDSGISCKGLFLNADAGFDSKKLRMFCSNLGVIPNFCKNKRNTKDLDMEDYPFDSHLYKERFVVERTNAWIDGFKNLIIRYETKALHWISLHYLAFAIIFLRKLNLLQL